MKKFAIFMLSFLAIGATISCDDNDEELFISNPSNQLMFKSTASSSYLLTFDTKDNLAERLVWTPVTFEVPIAINYEVQASNDPSNFENSLVVTSTNETTADISVERLNDISAELGLTPFSQGTIAMRVVGTTADVNMTPMISDVLILAVTPYTTETPKLYVPGNYADSSGYGANWTPEDSATPFLSAVEFGSTEFEGFIFMSNASPEFKLTPGQSFDGAYGDAGSGMLSTSGGNLTVPGPGYYFITANTDPDGDPSTDDATWTASARSWGIIGAATEPTNAPGWGDELDMTYNKDTKLWTVELNMQAEDFKFRAQQWDPATYNFGLKTGGQPNELSFGGGNLSVAAGGRYRAELDLSQPRNYTYSLTSI
jgi:hypothetical protein